MYGIDMYMYRYVHIYNDILYILLYLDRNGFTGNHTCEGSTSLMAQRIV